MEFAIKRYRREKARIKQLARGSRRLNWKRRSRGGGGGDRESNRRPQAKADESEATGFMVRIPTGTLVNALVDSCGGHVEWCKAVLIGGGTAVGWVRVIQPDDPSPALKVLVGKVFHAPWHNIEAHVEGLAEKGGRRDRDCKKLDDEMDLLSIETKSVAACRLLLEVETNQSYESMKPDDSSYLHAAMELVEEVVDKVRGVRRSLYPDGSEGDARGSK